MLVVPYSFYVRSVCCAPGKFPLQKVAYWLLVCSSIELVLSRWVNVRRSSLELLPCCGAFRATKPESAAAAFLIAALQSSTVVLALTPAPFLSTMPVVLFLL